MKLALYIFTTLSPFLLWAQGSFAPNASTIGTTAIHKDSSVFISWATNCEVTRGPQNIAVSGSPLVTSGTDSLATGKSGVNGTVSLGDGGSAILTFNQPIINGSGFDFAIFENGFNDSFLELAFVEVSSDGVNFYRFPATSETQDTLQTDSFGSTEASNLNNLAGKYRAQFGTPFDLQELDGQAGLDINSITHVKVIDVIGSIHENFASHDVNGSKINDPYPTDFATGGFDLDAVGVIHEVPVGIQNLTTDFSIFPNPTSDVLRIECSALEPVHVSIQDVGGRLVYKFPLVNSVVLDVSKWERGVYIVQMGQSTQKVILN